MRLRLLHPALALVAAAYLIWLLESEPDENRWARAAMYLVAAEIALGFLNVALAAPGWLQILHLLAAQVLWAALVLACASSSLYAQPPAPVVTETPSEKSIAA